MAFNDVYAHYNKVISGAAKEVSDGRVTFQSYLANHERFVTEAAIASGRKVIVEDKPMVTTTADILYFKWSFWNGHGHFNTGDPSSLTLRGKFSWSPSSPNRVQISGMGIDNDDDSLNNFVQDELLSHMVRVMDKVLQTQAENSYPHLR